jgi:hypothetical protein
MRLDQFETLQLRVEQLTDIFIDESDPKAWPGANTDPKEWSKSTRGDRYWHKRNCVATLTVVQRIATVVDLVREKTAGGDNNPASVGEEESELDALVASAEKEAERFIRNMNDGARKAGLDKRAIGK